MTFKKLKLWAFSTFSGMLKKSLSKVYMSTSIRGSLQFIQDISVILYSIISNAANDVVLQFLNYQIISRFQTRWIFLYCLPVHLTPIFLSFCIFLIMDHGNFCNVKASKFCNKLVLRKPLLLEFLSFNGLIFVYNICSEEYRCNIGP